MKTMTADERQKLMNAPLPTVNVIGGHKVWAGYAKVDPNAPYWLSRRVPDDSEWTDLGENR